MKDILSKVGKELLEVLKRVDWKPIVYKGIKEHLIPRLKERAANSKRKWDDVMVEGLERIFDAFLGDKELEPKAVVAKEA